MKTQLAHELGINSNKPMHFRDLYKIFKEYSLDNIRDLNIDYNIINTPEMTPLKLATNYNRANIVKYLLEECNVNVNHFANSNFPPDTALKLVKKDILNNKNKLENSTAKEGTNPELDALIEIKALLESAIQAISLTQDGSVQINKSTDFDVFVSVYKNKLLKTGFNGDFSSYLKTLKENESISAIRDKIEDSLKEARDTFLHKCNDLFMRGTLHPP